MATEKRLIDAGDLWSDVMMLPHNGDMISSEEVEQAIKEAPTVDAVEVVHGEWLFGELDVFGASVKCSNCGFGVDNADPILWMGYPGHKFCGACGAKMDGDGNG